MAMLRTLVIVLFLVIFLSNVYTQENTTSCEPPCLYMISSKTITRYSINKLTGLPNNINNPEVLYNETQGYLTSLEIDPVNNHIYIGDNYHNSIQKISLDGKNKTTLITYGVGSPSGLAVDWSSNILYWADHLTRRIEFSDTDGKNRRVLFEFNDDSLPFGLCAVPTLGYLFWSDYGNPKIERSSLSGEDRKVIVSTGLKWPHDLTFDYHSNRLYWIDSYQDVIESVNPDGSDRRHSHKLIFNRYIIHPYGIAYYAEQNISYVADWYTLYAMRAMNESKPILLLNNTGLGKEIHQLRIIDGFKMSATSPCLSESNACSHLCLKSSNNTHICTCPTGMQLATASLTQCVESSERDYEIYFTDSYAKSINHVIKYINQSGSVLNRLPVSQQSDLQYPIALDYAPISKYIYWADTKIKAIFRMLENGTNFQLFLHIKSITYSIAIDESTKSLYWIGDNGRSIMRSSLDGQYNKTIKTGFRGLIEITLYEEKGFIFYSDYGGNSFGRINTDGTDLKRVTSSLRRKYYITGITIDKIEDRIYYCDEKQYSVESRDLNFGNYRKVIQKSTYSFLYGFRISNKIGSISRPFGMTLLGDRIFWTDLRRRAIFVADKHSGAKIDYVTGGLDHPRDIHVYSDRARTEYRKIYKFSFDKSGRSARCYPVSCSEFRKKLVSDPEKCPIGYKETNLGSTCSKCSDPVGANFRCKCTDWKTCAQRGYGNILGCHASRPYTYFKVRECTQTVKPGFCPYELSKVCFTAIASCNSDDDCSGQSKCCKTACGNSVCHSPVVTSDHPCTINNGGCSHFCNRNATHFECSCPTGMTLDKAGKNCIVQVYNSSDICGLPAEHGPCRPFAPIIRWHFNDETKICESFSYGGCRGNENNFYTKEQCEYSCSGTCIPFTHDSSTCAKQKCTADSECRGKQLCCLGPCGDGCRNPAQLPVPTCYQAAPIGSCNGTLWYYDIGQKGCRMKSTGGCDTSTQNKFKDKDSCQNTCAHIVCDQEQDSGPCKAFIRRWSYNKTAQRCEQFVFGGCRPNDNNFFSLSSCKASCQRDIVSTTVTTSQSSKTSPKMKTTKAISSPATTVVKTTKTQATSTQTTKYPIWTTTGITIKSFTTPDSVKITSTTTEEIIKSVTTEKPSVNTTTTTTTTQPVTTTPTSVCSPSPCLNGGACSIMMCLAIGCPPFSCSCPALYYGAKCEIYSGNDLVQMEFQKTTSKSVSRSKMSSTIAIYMTLYCRNNQCVFTVASHRRGRRESPPMVTEFSSNDIITIDFNENSNSLTFNLLVLQPVDSNGIRNGYLSKDDMEASIKLYSDRIGNDLGLKYGDAGKNKPHVSDDDHDKVTTPLTIFFAIIVAILLLIIIAYIAKRHREKKKAALAQTNPSVRVSFENQLYDDLYPNNVTLPPYPENANNISFANPTFNTPLPNETDAAAINPIPEKNPKADWVEFSESDDKKIPITDFVEPTDLYNIEAMLDEPPEYYSRSGTPIQNKDKSPRTLSTTSLGTLPSYSSIWTPGMPEITQEAPYTVTSSDASPRSGDENVTPVVPKQISVAGNTNC